MNILKIYVYKTFRTFFSYTDDLTVVSEGKSDLQRCYASLKLALILCSFICEIALPPFVRLAGLKILPKEKSYLFFLKQLQQRPFYIRGISINYPFPNSLVRRMTD